MNSAASSMIPQLDGGLKGNAVLYQSSCHVRMPAVFKNQWGKNDAPDYTASPARVSGVSAIYFTLARRALTDGVFHHEPTNIDRKSTRLNSSHANISYAVFCLN